MDVLHGVLSSMPPDFPAFPSIILDDGRARLYRVHGKVVLVAVAVDVPSIGEIFLLAFCEGRRLPDHALIARHPDEILHKMQSYRAGADPETRPTRPSADEAPDIAPLFDRDLGYNINAAAFSKGVETPIVPLRPE